MTSPLRTPARPWSVYAAPVLVLLCVGVILVATLTPFRFDFSRLGDVGALATRFSQGISDYEDIANNIVLFVPLGFALTWWLHTRHWRLLTALLTVCAAGVALSLLVETLQLLLPARTATPFDVLMNSLGALGGCLTFVALRGWLQSLGSFVVGLACYAITMTVFAIMLQTPGSVRSWDPTYPLVIGNEATGDRPWNGTVPSLQIANVALDPDQAQAVANGESTSALASVVAAYTLTGTGVYADATGTLPNLVQQSSAQAQPAATGSAAQDQWFATAGPARTLTEQLRTSGQFTLVATVATADAKQYGPARIISLSDDPLHRNVTLAQQGDDLVVRVRNMVTGRNGDTPNLTVPDVFATTTPRQVVVTYDTTTLRAYTNVTPPATLRFTPAQAFFSMLTPPEFDQYLISSNPQILPIYTLLYYALFFVPIGLLLAAFLHWQRPGLPFWAQVALSIGVGFVVALLIEGILVGTSGREVVATHVLLGGFFAACGAFVPTSVLPRRRRALWLARVNE